MIDDPPVRQLRRFRFNLPQRIAAGLLALFLLQGLWLTGRQTLTDRDYQYARCGRETWERPSPLAGYYTSCGNIHDGILAYRLAGLPLTLNLLAERGLDQFRKPEVRVRCRTGGELSTWELRHQLTHILLLLRLPFLFAGCVLGGCIWWVTRRLFGDLGGYTALALYCFCPAILKACVAPNTEVLAALGMYGGVYTCIGVAHAMPGPRRKWRPRIVLLTVIFGLAASSHIAALPVTALLGLAPCCGSPRGAGARRCRWLVAAVGALALLFACYGFSPDAFSYVFRSAAAFLWFSIDPARRFFSTLATQASPWPPRPRWCCIWPAQIALLRQHRSAVVRSGFVAAGADGRAGQPVAVGAAVSAHLCRRRLCRRLRRAAEAAGPWRPPGAIVAASGRLLRP